MKVFNLVALILLLLGVVTINGQTHKIFTDILQKYVTDGLVNYKALAQDQDFETYLNQLSNTDPSKLSEKEELAFWINTYNAFTIKAILDYYPVKSINDIKFGEKSVWDEDFISINNKKYSLNDIEHKILRKMNEPRIHFAIVCASISCPELLNEAFESNTLEKQLERQTKTFLNDKTRNDFDLKNKKANISEIFNWFDKDFGESNKDVLRYIAEFLPADIREDINQNIDEWEILYKNYDWNLNEIK
ncbi:MAG: DUF547 domain-containing protein [Ignavibacteriaceae bacterium]|jgi:hypothetical protein|nr:DUF547 domain-containing protein [Ignavibacteriaceae bacterium]MCW8812843.1 DUF547 domain-containing protein [Chlorobium sp.]MCW8816905.1 DUF547 domain-containing protein [Ignavibacteriaceae bacterium]MCW8824112.1 DUF547 domain-containing protein [Ignavibacteriaceae bacterium]MCW8960005.1 DUF547 domain-containing protein [Ignavibacteriaceae bacterium]